MTHLQTPRLLLLLAAFALAGCDAASPLQPSSPGTASATFTLSGTVTGPGGIPLAGAKVSVAGNSVSFRVVQTDELGRFAAAGLSGHVRAVVDKAGYDKQTTYVTMISDQVRDISMRLDTTIGIQAGDTATITMLSDDPAYDFPTAYSECPAPCKAIRIFSSATSQMPVSILVRARDQSRRMQIFVQDGWVEFCCVAEKNLIDFVGAGMDTVFHVRFNDGAGSNGDPRIDIATSFQQRQIP